MRAYHVCGLWMVRQEVKEPPRFLDIVDRVGSQRVHQIWKLQTIADEEHLHIKQLEISLLG